MTMPNGPSGQPAPQAPPAAPPAPAPAPPSGQPPAGGNPAPAPTAPPSPAGNGQPASQPAPQLSDQHAQALLADAITRANAANATGTAVNEHGYPDNTPVQSMTHEQQVAYWRHHARKHEDRVKQMADYEALQAKASELDALVAASRTEQEKAIDEARKQARQQTMTEVGGQLVEAHVQVAAAGRATPEALSALLDGLDKSRFLTADGKVDADRVSTYVNAVLPTAAPAAAPASAPAAPPAAPSGPDMGQGRRDTTKPSGLEAGRAAARARFGLDKNSNPGQHQ